MVGGFHGNGDVGNFIVNGILGAGQRLIRENDLTITLVRGKVGVAVLSDEPPQAFAHIQQLELGK